MKKILVIDDEKNIRKTLGEILADEMHEVSSAPDAEKGLASLIAEKPDAILPTVGGQTGLNLAVELVENGIVEKYGITPETELILYCRTSVRAAVEFIAFKNILNYENVKVYDGAYLEWAASHPIVQ